MQQETSGARRSEEYEKLRIVESELRAKHPNWTQAKAQFFAKKLLCMIH